MNASEIPVALLAGFLSFLAPCVLPLVPGYLSAVSAVEADELGRPGTARRVVVSSIPFVLGFTAFFVLLGVGASLLGGSIFRDQFVLEQVAGFVLVVFGLAFMGLLPWPERLVGAGLVQGARSRGSRVLLGGAFAVCAAPCIGPVLAAILVLILFILLHAGRGGGLSDMFGGAVGGGSLAGSTVVERNLDRMTVVVSLVFMFSTIVLSLRLT